MPATVDFEELPKIDFEETPAIAFEPIVPPIRTTPPRVPRPVPVTNPRPLAGRLADAVSGAIGDPSGMGMAGFAQTAKDFALNPLGTAAKTFAPGLDMSKPLVPVTVPEGTPLGEGIGDFVKNVVGGLSTPDTITTFAQAGLGPAAAEVVSAKFISQMAVDAPDQAADVGKKLAAGDKRGATTALLNYALDTVGAGAVAKGALGKPVPPPIQFEEIPDRPNNLIQLEGAPPGELPPEPEETAPAAPVASPEAKGASSSGESTGKVPVVANAGGGATTEQPRSTGQPIPAPEPAGKGDEKGIIARTEPVERADVDHGTRQTEYRARKVSDAERNARWETYGNTPWAVERRTIKRNSDTGEVDEGEWSAFARGETKQKAIEDGIGDTGLRTAPSLDETHKKVSDAVNARRAWDTDKAKRLEDARRESNWATQEMLRIKEDANKKYSTALKRAKVYDEAQQGKADPEKIKQIQAKLQSEWLPKYESAKLDATKKAEFYKAIEAEQYSPKLASSPTPKPQFQSLDDIDASKLTPAQKVKARDKFLKAQGVKPAEEPPVQSRMSAGPGAAAAGEPGTYSNIQQLSDKIKATAPQSATPADRISLIDRMKVSAESAKDSIKGAFAKAQAVKDALVSGYMTQPEWTDYKRIKGKWDYAVQKADFQSSNFLKQVRKEVPSKLRQEAITNWIQADGDEAVLRERASGAKAAFRQGYEAALKLTDREKELAGYIRDYFDRQLELGQNEGILKNGLEDYVTQVWKKENPVTTKLMSEISSSKLQPNFKFARKRVFDSFYEGEQAGFKPASKAIGDLLAHYDQTFNRSLAAREFLKNLRDNNASDGRPLAEVSGYGRPVEETDAQGKPISGTIDKYTVKPRALGDKLQGYRNIDHPALKGWKWAATTADGKPILFEGPLVVHPEIYQDLKNVLSKSSWRQMPVVREYLSAQREIKQTMLTFAGFHQVQETVHALGHLVNPLKTPEIDMEEPVTKALTEHGLQVFSFDAAKEFGEGVSSSGGLAKYIPVIGKSLHDYTQFLFQNIIPRLKISMARDALERNRKLYSKTLNEDQLLALTSREANAAFGEENLRSLGRNPNVQDAFNFFLFAPDFLISRGKFVGQALKPYGREQMMALGRIALTSYVAARLVNKWLDDDPHWELRNAFSVVYGKHRYSLRTVPGDILHMLTDPRSFWYNRISPGTRTVMELATGRDDRGVRRDALQQLNDAGQMLVPLGLRKRDDQNLLEAFANSFGIQTQRDTPEQQIHEKIDDWKRKTGVKQSAFEETYDQDKDVNRPLRLALEAGDLAKSKVAFDKLEKATPDREVRGKMESGKDQIRTAMEAHFTRPLTGSKANEAAFVKSLTPGERKEYEAAQASRQKQLKLFEEIAGKKLPAWAKPPPLRR